MARSYKGNGNLWVLVLLLFVGGLCGSALGNALAPVVPWLKATSTIGFRCAMIRIGSPDGVTANGKRADDAKSRIKPKK